MTNYLADSLLKYFQGRLIVLQGGLSRDFNCDNSTKVATHSHEEADTLIPLHVLDTLNDGREKNVDVHCADTDILLLLMDLVANNRLNATCQISMIKTGKTFEKVTCHRKSGSNWNSES